MRLPLRRVLVRGPSMAPTLSDGDIVLAIHRDPRPGDIVLVTWRARPGQLSIKRVVRRDGDGWHVRGDNRFADTAVDSRLLGAAQVHAVVLWRLWPRPGRLT